MRARERCAAGELLEKTYNTCSSPEAGLTGCRSMVAGSSVNCYLYSRGWAGLEAVIEGSQLFMMMRVCGKNPKP